MRAELSDYTHISAGKVREIYAIDDETLLMVASDRISAFDHVLEPEIPDKGRVLTAMSCYYFSQLDVENHVIAPPDDPRIPEEVLGRALVCRKLSMIPFECVARGYLTGSGLKEYRETGSVCGVKLADGLVKASRLPEPIFTPATKAPMGHHDVNVTFEALVEKIGTARATQIKETTLRLYTQAAEIALANDLILADTKFEFGVDDSGNLVLADEVLTPDSSRYWPLNRYEVGTTQPSFDKQYVRDWLTGPKSGWDRASGATPPALPGSVVEATRQRYIDAYEKVSGKKFTDWIGCCV